MQEMPNERGESMVFIRNFDTKIENCRFDSHNAAFAPQWTFLNVQTARAVTMLNSNVTTTIASVRFKLASPALRIEANRFEGQGVLRLAPGDNVVSYEERARGRSEEGNNEWLKEAVIASNTFESGFRAEFGDVTHGILMMRNNINMSYSTAKGRAVQCDAAANLLSPEIKTGVDAG